jgi:tRNA G10  N-methylase Trm11
MKYLVRFAQMHESFRQAETDSLAELNGVQLEWVSYSDEVCLFSGRHACVPSHVYCCSRFFKFEYCVLLGWLPSDAVYSQGMIQC